MEETGNRGRQGAACLNLGNSYLSLKDYAKAVGFLEQARVIMGEVGNLAGQGRVANSLGCCYLNLKQYAQAIPFLEQALDISLEAQNRAGQWSAYSNLGLCYSSIGNFKKALELHTLSLDIGGEVGDRAHNARAYTNLGKTHIQHGNTDEAARAFMHSLENWQRVEQDVGVQDDNRVSLMEEQLITYKLLQEVLLENGQRQQAEWAMAVCCQAKARALSYKLGGVVDDTVPGDLPDRLYEDLCSTWWAEAQELARGEGEATRIVEFSLLFNDTLAIWVLSGDGELLSSCKVPSTGLGEIKGRTIEQLLAEARTSMKVRGRDAMVSSATTRDDLSDSNTDQGTAASVRKPRCRVCNCAVCECAHMQEHAEADLASQTELLQEMYRVLLKPIEASLVGASELLIVPHQELFNVPWAALIDADGRYLIESFVIRVVPSLQVAAQTAKNVRQHCAVKPGHVVLVANPLPLPKFPKEFRSLPQAAEEGRKIHDVLNKAEIEVNQQHYFREAFNPKATKSRVKESLQGAIWAHIACHGDLETDSLIFADTGDNLSSNLSMNEIQGTDTTEGLKGCKTGKGVQLSCGATVVLSACNTGRGEIKAEGVVGLARGFLMANAAATVMSLWSVSCFHLCFTIHLYYVMEFIVHLDVLN